jgi:hypothetical protein
MISVSRTVTGRAGLSGFRVGINETHSAVQLLKPEARKIHEASRIMGEALVSFAFGVVGEAVYKLNHAFARSLVKQARY